MQLNHCDMECEPLLRCPYKDNEISHHRATFMFRSAIDRILNLNTFVESAELGFFFPTVFYPSM